MHRPNLLIGLITVFVLVISIIFGAATSSQAAENDLVPNQLTLSVYVDEDGKCLVNGYILDPGSLSFLNSSVYTYEDEIRQLYAITNALTSKSADNWSVRFVSEGNYEEYRIIFYLPADAKLSGVNCSEGLDYLVYAANRSVVAEIQGHDVADPAAEIGYALQLSEATLVQGDIVTGAGADADAGRLNAGPYSIQYIAIALLILLLACSGVLIYFSRSRSKSVRPEECLATHEHLIGSLSSGYGNTENEDQVQSVQNRDGSAGGVGAGIEITREISTVIDTLTDKEQSIFNGLLRRGGRMTQRDISYDLDISKSSLSGILTSMEKRKLITKRGEGRTNIIELSERFLNNKKRS